MTRASNSTGGGLLYALGAHAVWGSMPLYLVLVREVPPLEYVAWRILVTLPLCFLVLTWSSARGRGGWDELKAVLADRRALGTLLASSALIAINWFLYVWAIQTGHVYAASLGYYILPLMMMMLGLVVLGERLSRWQWAAVALAGVGVTVLASGALTTLWLSLGVALSFAIYGLLRKTVAAGAVVGLTVEALLLLVPALAIVGWYAAGPRGSALGRDALETVALLGGGPMTAVPLLCFAVAARRMPYAMLGFLQFIAPTIVFLLGLFWFGEDLSKAQLACFIAIWAAVGLFVWDLLRGRGKPPLSDEEATHGAAA